MKTFLKFYENVDNTEYYKNIKLDKEFETTLDEKDCYIHQELDDNKDIMCHSAKIYWGIKIQEDSNRGISDIEIIIKKIVCEITTDEIDGDNEPVDEVVVYEFENIKTEININVTNSKRLSIYPLEIDIRYDDNLCTVNF